MRGAADAAVAVEATVSPGGRELPFNPVLGPDGAWVLEPTEDEKLLDEERARVSKLPRYVVAGNDVHGEPRYGVKIKIPGQRGQVRAPQSPARSVPLRVAPSLAPLPRRSALH